MASRPRVLAIVPARGGSKGIPLKNLKTVAGKSLLARTLELAQSVPEITDICVSTDHSEIRTVALSFDGVAVIDRPEELSGDRVADSPVLQHATAEMEKSSGQPFDVVVMLQVTSPLRTIDDVRDSIAKLVTTDAMPYGPYLRRSFTFTPSNSSSLTMVQRCACSTTEGSRSSLGSN